MKQMLITGAGGYIGGSFRQYMEQFPDEYAVHTVSLRETGWRSADFSRYDVVLHAAGIAHLRETRENAALYDRINRDLTKETAEKAKAEGVGQFIFLSSMSVYGMEEGVITPDTAPGPGTAYGRSKLEAEQLLLEIQSESFQVAILRLPMVYGEGCKGNYQVLVRLAEILPVCPNYKNARSMISIENLCGYLKNTADTGGGGILVPQDPEYVCTCRMIRQIARDHGRRLPLVSALNFGPALLRRFTVRGRKAFGSLVYQDEGQCNYAGVQR